MFATERDDIVAGLERLRPRLCCYMSDPCDCKYGVADDRVGSEQTGCPEVRLAATLFRAMTDDEYADLLRRSRCLTSADVMDAIAGGFPAK